MNYNLKNASNCNPCSHISFLSHCLSNDESELKFPSCELIMLKMLDRVNIFELISELRFLVLPHTFFSAEGLQ